MSCIIMDQCNVFSRTEMMEFSSDYILTAREKHNWGKTMAVNCYRPMLMRTSLILFMTVLKIMHLPDQLAHTSAKDPAGFFCWGHHIWHHSCSKGYHMVVSNHLPWFPGFMQRLHCIAFKFLRVVLISDNPHDIWYCFWLTILAEGLAIAITMNIALQIQDLLRELYRSYKYPTQSCIQGLGMWQQDESLGVLDLLWCGHGLRLYSYPVSACLHF